jgi:hypothetical protein
MAQPLQVNLLGEQREELIDVRDRHDNPDGCRERESGCRFEGGRPSRRGGPISPPSSSFRSAARAASQHGPRLDACLQERGAKKRGSTDLSLRKAAGRSPLFPWPVKKRCATGCASVRTARPGPSGWNGVAGRSGCFDPGSGRRVRRPTPERSTCWTGWESAPEGGYPTGCADILHWNPYN